MSQHSQTGSNGMWKDVLTRRVDVGGTKFVYRQLGPDTGMPVIFLNHLAADLDRWDPRVVDGIAARRRVIVFDNRGIGASEGSVPTSIAAMARRHVYCPRASARCLHHSEQKTINGPVTRRVNEQDSRGRRYQRASGAARVDSR